jgi:hypothetical protein
VSWTPTFADPNHNVNASLVRYLGSLHTRAKSHDHEITRAHTKCPNAIPRHFQNHVVWSYALKCNVKSRVIVPLNNCYFNEFLFMRGPRTWQNIVTQRLWDFGVSWSCIRPTSKRWFLRIVQVTMKHGPFDNMYESMWTFTSILHPLLHWSLKHSVEANLDRLHLFPPWQCKCLKRNSHGQWWFFTRSLTCPWTCSLKK